MKKKIQLIALLHFGVVTYFWFKASAPLFEFLDVSSVYLAIGRLSGLYLASATLLQFLLMARIPIIENTYSQESLTEFHKKNGRVVFALLFIHYISIVNAYSIFAGITQIEQIISFINDVPVVLLAIISFWLFLLVALSSIFFKRLKLKYEVWYGLHLATYVAILLAFLHQIRLGGTLTNTILGSYWIMVFALSLVAFVYFRFVRLFIRHKKHSFYVKQVVNSKNFVEIVISGKNLDHFKYYAGQYLNVRFLTRRLFFESHPFSISSGTNEKDMRLVIKKLGDFTSKLSDLRVGVSVLVDGPHGKFVAQRSEGVPVLILAGGVGITPIAGLLKDFESKKDVVLFYSGSFYDEMPLLSEVKEVCERKKFSLRLFVSQEKKKNKADTEGRINIDHLSSISKLGERFVYICGGEGFRKEMVKNLIALGVDANSILYEKFSLH